MNDEMRKEVLKMIREEVPKIIEELFSKSLRQLREFFLQNIN